MINSRYEWSVTFGPPCILETKRFSLYLLFDRLVLDEDFFSALFRSQMLVLLLREMDMDHSLSSVVACCTFAAVVVAFSI